ncbi:MAG: inhibitor of cysteine peptidase [Methyloprofundus sp.]|nr:MAG: inhibitor of cysteine peptidase [Methyloprofundus sp.]
MKKLIAILAMTFLSFAVSAQDLRAIKINGLTTVPDITIHGQLTVAGQETDTFIISNNKQLTASFEVSLNHVNLGTQPHKLYLLAKYNSAWFAKNTEGQWIAWDGALATLPHFAFKNSSSTETILAIDTAQLPVGEYQLHTAYASADMQSGITFNRQPLNFVVYDPDNEGLQRLDSDLSLANYLKKAITKNNIYESYLVVEPSYYNSGGSGLINGFFPNGPFYPSVFNIIPPLPTTPLTNIVRHEVQQGSSQQTGLTGIFQLLANYENFDYTMDIHYTSLLGEAIQQDIAAEIEQLDSLDRPAEMFYYQRPSSDTTAAQQSLIIVRSEDLAKSHTYTGEVYIDTQPARSVFIDGLQYTTPAAKYTSEKLYTSIEIKDASHPNEMSTIHHFTLDGERVSSYQHENKLYVVMRHAPKVNGFFHFADDSSNELNKPFDELLYNTPLSTLLPSITLNEQPAQTLINGENCYIPTHAEITQESDVYTSITVFPLDNPTAFHTSCLLTSIDAVYGAGDAMYLFKQRDSLALNNLYKFAYHDAQLIYKGATTLVGYPKFAKLQKNYYIDEHNDILRILSLTEPNTLSLIQQLPEENKLVQASFTNLPQQLSRKDNLIQFSGSRLVWFARERVSQDAEGLDFYTEVYRPAPLFVMDLSDPYQPQELGQIQTNGYLFSLYPINDRYLMGIGKASGAAVTDQQGQAQDYAHSQGAKLSLYDLSDKNQLGEVAAMTIGKRGTESALFFDARAYAFTPETAEQPARFVLPIALAETAQETSNIPGNGEFDYHYTTYLADITIQDSLHDNVLSESDFYAVNHNLRLGPPLFGWVETGAYVFEINTSAAQPHINLFGKLLIDTNETDINYPHRKFIGNSGNTWKDQVILNDTGLYYRHKIGLSQTLPVNYFSTLDDLQ